MKVAVYRMYDESMAEIWEIDSDNIEELSQLITEERVEEAYALVKEKGKIVEEHIDAYIVLDGEL